MSKITKRSTILKFKSKVSNVNVINDGKTVEIFFEENMPKKPESYIDKYFPVAELSKLSLSDNFLKYKPETENQKVFKQRLIRAIKSGLVDIRVQRMDPSIDEEDKIYYEAGSIPGTEKSVMWWKKTAENFMPSKNSRIGSTYEWIGFLGLIIKYLVEERHYSLSRAWYAVCDNSKNLGHYADSVNALNDIEVTGKRKVGEWYDLGNVGKLTIYDYEMLKAQRAGGNCIYNGSDCPLAHLVEIYKPYKDYMSMTGWIVLSK